MRVKICGITNIEDATISISGGADGLGFLFWKQSPRYISPQSAKMIINQLPPFIEKVGLFVNHSASEINYIAKESGITLAQLHFEISEDEVEKLEIPYIRVVRAKQIKDIQLYKDEYRFIDAFTQEYGGVGKRLNLDWFKGNDNSKIILAGGLTPENLHELQGFGFYGVDVSSGVEKAKGKKSKEKLLKFIQIAKGLK